MTAKSIAKQLTPPVLWSCASRTRELLQSRRTPLTATKVAEDGQDLDIYWTEQAVRSMEVWGEGTAWDEIQYLLVNLEGRVLDIACGTGKTMELLSQYSQLELHGFDISDLLIQKAHERGIDAQRAIVCDATSMAYPDQSFDYSYSIGSLEHFTDEGIGKFISECRRVTKRASFHQIPVSRSDRDEGWMKTMQSFHNNSVAWWRRRFAVEFETVHALDSRWNDDLSVGKWFVCH